MNIALTFTVRINNHGCPWITVAADLDGKSQPVELKSTPTTVSFDLEDTGAEHCLTVSLKGKRPRDTHLDAKGDIFSDVIVTVDSFELDGIKIDPLVREFAEYVHDANGHLEQKQSHKFYNDLGCNGDVVFRFSTPAYLWLLERM